jgi:hypothetical protein
MRHKIEDLDDKMLEFYKKREAAFNQMTDEFLERTFGHKGLPTDEELEKWELSH